MQSNDQTVLFDLFIKPYLVLSLWVTMDMDLMTKKGYAIFSKVSGVEPHH